MVRTRRTRRGEPERDHPDGDGHPSDGNAPLDGIWARLVDGQPGVTPDTVFGEGSPLAEGWHNRLDPAGDDGKLRMLAALSLYDLGRTSPGPNDLNHIMEMGRRMIIATATLTGEIGAFRRTSAEGAKRLEVLTKWIIMLTFVLVVLTGVLIYFAANPPQAQLVPAPAASHSAQAAPSGSQGSR
jgi:hypothetical protein